MSLVINMTSRGGCQECVWYNYRGKWGIKRERVNAILRDWDVTRSWFEERAKMGCSRSDGTAQNCLEFITDNRATVGQGFFQGHERI